MTCTRLAAALHQRLPSSAAAGVRELIRNGHGSEAGIQAERKAERTAAAGRPFWWAVICRQSRSRIPSSSHPPVRAGQGARMRVISAGARHRPGARPLWSGRPGPRCLLPSLA
jgi:hypothetical protein